MNIKVQQRAIEILNEARERMNDKGRHWIKWHYRAKKDGEQAYCSVGALMATSRKTKARMVATIALADEIAPGRMEDARHSLVNIGSEPYVRNCLYQEAKSVIIIYNDDYHTRWSGVSSKFKKAAKTLEREMKNANS